VEHLEKISTCPLCKATSFSKFIETKDFSLTQETFTLAKCNSCNLIFTNPRPKEEFLPDYYKFEDYISHTDSDKGIINKLYKSVRNYALKQKQKIIETRTISQQKRILDYGCGTGYFLAHMQKNGFEVTGFEPDKGARNVAKRTHGINVEDNLNNIQEGFDIITFWHVLEHIYHLNETVNTLIEKLEKNGLLIIAVPNPDSFDAKYYQKFWAAYDVPRHLYHFTPDVIMNYFLAKNLQIETVLPMYFDAFYVSMLSEKYKGGNLLKAGLVGLRSNLNALLSKKPEFSSQIYVFRK
jgi:2-polyprenyl-3-methyl-5-hydroxy-6-metoxy-1,4-benzoquinol methylase